MDVYFLTTSKWISNKELGEIEKLITHDNGKLETAHLKHSIPLPNYKRDYEAMGSELVVSGYPTFLWVAKYSLPDTRITLGKVIKNHEEVSIKR